MIAVTGCSGQTSIGKVVSVDDTSICVQPRDGQSWGWANPVCVENETWEDHVHVNVRIDDCVSFESHHPSLYVKAVVDCSS